MSITHARPNFLKLVLIAGALAAGPVAATAAEASDPDLVALCVEELKSRQPAGEVQDNTEVVFSHVERAAQQQVVDVQVTEAEGRRVAGRCIVRNGKVFDFKG